MDLFWFQVGLSFVIGGLYIGFTIWLAEKFGSKLGGMLLGLPSTALISLIFIGWTGGISAVEQATIVMPVSVLAVTAFLIVFQRLQEYGAIKAYLAAIATWFAFSLPLVLLKIDNIVISIALALIGIGFGLFYFQKTPDKTTAKNRFDQKEFLLRAVFSGLVIAVAVYLAKTAGPLWGGVFAMFPAAFSSSILLLHQKHGPGFTDAVIKSMQRALGPITAFVIVAHYTVGPFGLAGGLAAGYGAAVLTAIAKSFFIK